MSKGAKQWPNYWYGFDGGSGVSFEGQVANRCDTSFAGSKAGGSTCWTSSRRRGRSTPEDVRAKELHRPLGVRRPRPFDGQVANRVEEWIEESMEGAKATSTERAYAGSWEKWKAWVRRHGWESEYLNRKGDPVENENVAGIHRLPRVAWGIGSHAQSGHLCGEGRS